MSITEGKRSASFLGINLLALLGACSKEPKVHALKQAELAHRNLSAQWKGGRFVNAQPLWMDTKGLLLSLFSRNSHAEPAVGELPTQAYVGAVGPVAREALKATWFGHSTVLLELDGSRILLDPVWADRSSPVQFVGPKRWYPAPLHLSEVPPLDAVLISHNHYDHLDEDTIRALSARTQRFIVPLGVAVLLRDWGVEAERIQELDWWESTRVGALEVHSTPARHASGRGLFDKDKTLWSGYALLGPSHRVYYSGDTGMMEAFDEIGERLGPFDLTLLEIGEYAQEWPDWHMGPEQAVSAHRKVRGRVMLPVHWGLLKLSSHTWTEPIERACVAARKVGVSLATPLPGQTLDFGVTQPELGMVWWPALPWRSAEEYPIVSTKQGQAFVADAVALAVLQGRLEVLQRDLRDLAYELDQRSEHEASDVASSTAARVGTLLGTR